MRRGGFGNRGRTLGTWPGNGPFRHLPPWERPGWLYGQGSCWFGVYPNMADTSPITQQKESQILQDQKRLLEEQVRAVQERLAQIEKRLSEVDSE